MAKIERESQVLLGLLAAASSVSFHTHGRRMSKIALTWDFPVGVEVALLEQVSCTVLRNQFGGPVEMVRPESLLTQFAMTRNRQHGRVRLDPIWARQALQRDGDPPNFHKGLDPSSLSRGPRLDIRHDQAGFSAAVMLHHAIEDTGPDRVRSSPRPPVVLAGFCASPGHETNFILEANPPVVALASQEGYGEDDLEAFWIAHKTDIIAVDGRFIVDRDCPSHAEEVSRKHGPGALHYFCWPNSFFSRDVDGDYPVHPTYKGEARPETPPTGTDADPVHDRWIGGDGAWIPKAQAPSRVFVLSPEADPELGLGRLYRNPAFFALKEMGFLPRDAKPTTLPDDFPMQLSERIGSDRKLARSLEELVGLTCKAVGVPWMATAKGIADLLGGPNHQVKDDRLAEIQVVKLVGSPAPEHMTWRFPGLDLELFESGDPRHNPCSARDFVRTAEGLRAGFKNQEA